MPIKLKKINNKWYTPDNRLYVGSAIQDRNIYWYGTDGSRTYLRRKGVYRPSPEIINYVKRTEAFSPTWYKDGNGHWTIGYGMKETSELRRKYPHSITKELADAEFLNLANTYSLEMYLNTPNAQALNQNQLDALFSYYYNLGLTNYTQKSPTFQNALKSANWNEVVNQMDFGYNDIKNPGLKKRRDYERQLFQAPVTIPKHYKGGQLIKHNINVYKQGGNMKVKDNNQTKLIPQKLIGGLIPKFQKASGKLFTRLEYERRYSNRNYNKAHLLNGKWHRAILNRDKNGNETVTLQTWKPLPKNYYVKNGGIYEKTGFGDIRVDTYKGSRYEAGKPAPNHKRPADRSVTLTEIDDAKKLNAGIQASKNKSTDTKPAGTQGSDTKGGIRGNSIRGNARSTAKPAATTTTTIPVATSTTTPASTSTENAGNYTIQRGDTLGTLAKRFGMSVDELARLNNISNPNRIYAGRTLITKAPTAETSDIKVETPNVPDYGYGVTDSNLKLGTDLQYYPSYSLDELLRSAFSKFGLNFDDYKRLTADKLPTNVASVSQEIKTFNPGNTVLTPSYKALRDARLEDEALKRSKLLPFAKQGTKLIRRK